MVDDITTQCIECCLAISDAAGAAASRCLRWGDERTRTETVNALVTCSAVTRMISERLEGGEPVDASLLTLGIDVCRSAGRICTEADDPELRPCQLAASACIEAIRAVQALD